MGERVRRRRRRLAVVLRQGTAPCTGKHAMNPNAGMAEVTGKEPVL